jgi:RNA polymerase sigma-70 factor (ECF subfamily)
MAQTSPDAERLRALFEEHERRLHGSAIRLCGDPNEAWDLVQDTFEKVLRNLGKLPMETFTEAWLWTVLHNTFIDRCRRRKREATVSVPVEALPVAAPEPDAPSVWESVSVEAVRKAIAELSDEFREVYEMHAAGASYIQISEKLGIPKATVGTRLARARRKLKAALLGRTEE